MLTGKQIREARVLLGLTRSRLAAKVKTVTTLTIIRAEEFDAHPELTVAQTIAVERAFERLGVEFTPAGPRLRPDHP